MAVWAPELAREAVFDAIRNRRTYGSTGSRIYLEFTVNGEPMGGETTVAAGQPVAVRAEALGTGPLRWIHVLRGDLDRPDTGFQCRPPSMVSRQQRAAGFQPRLDRRGATRPRYLLRPRAPARPRPRPRGPSLEQPRMGDERLNATVAATPRRQFLGTCTMCPMSN